MSPRRSPGRGVLAASVLLLVAGLAACGEPGPREIRIGADECAHCRMRVSVHGFASQLLTDRGLSYVFDSIECLAEFLGEGDEVPEERIGSLWVTNFKDPDAWLPAEDAVYLRSEAIRSPMGLNLSAYADRASAVTQSREYPGEILTWDQVLALVDETGVRMGGGHGHGH